MDRRAERQELEQRLYYAREDRANDDSCSTRLIMIERIAREALEAFDAAHPEIIAEIRADRAAEIERKFNESAVARGTD